jgi:hypothetical protein
MSNYKKLFIVFKEQHGKTSPEIISQMSEREKLMLRPFFPTKAELAIAKDPEEADLIYVPSTSGNTRENYEYTKLLTFFKRYEEKFVYYINDDNPDYVYDGTKSTKFVAQPSRGKFENHRNNVVVVPLIMTDHYYLDKDYVKSLRNIPKEYDFCFIGNTQTHGRQIFHQIKVPKFLFRDTTGFSVYPQTPADKLDHINKFLEEIAKSKYVFAPRGDGSSSFRLYESMMVGSIPIVTGMNDYPFENNVNWDTFSIRTTLDFDGLKAAAKRTREVDYDDMKAKAIDFYDNYCDTSTLHTKLINELCEKLGS